MLERRETEKGTQVSAGYPAIEHLIDTENFDQTNAVFEKVYGELAGIARVKRGLKKSREAKKAMNAIDLVMSLFKELLEIKYRIQDMLKRSQARKV